ncbi:hypothetical protein KBD81_02310 [Candidatus Woesebacteria bacterium]|nr:hypothetical protein [Candidatus Woesebacteria bacterium]
MEEMPELAGYLPHPSYLARAKTVFRYLPDLVLNSRSRLAGFYDRKNPKRKLTMFVGYADEIPLIFTPFTRNHLGILIPVLGCTSLALDHISDRTLYSDNALLRQLCEMSQEEVFTYEPETMGPEDYIALAAQGLFWNEPFRMAFDSETGVPIE